MASHPGMEMDDPSSTMPPSLVQWRSGHSFHSRTVSDTEEHWDSQDTKIRIGTEDESLAAGQRSSARKPYSGLKPLFTQPFARISASDGTQKDMEMHEFPNLKHDDEISPHEPDSKHRRSSDSPASSDLVKAHDRSGGNASGSGTGRSHSLSVQAKRTTSRLSTADGTYISFGEGNSEVTSGSQQISSRRGKFPVPLKIKRPHTVSGGATSGPTTSFASPIERIGRGGSDSAPGSPGRKSSARLSSSRGPATAHPRIFSESQVKREGASEGGILNTSGNGSMTTGSGRTWRGPIDWFDAVDPVRLGLEDEEDEDGKRFPAQELELRGGEDGVAPSSPSSPSQMTTTRRHTSLAMSPRTDTRDFNMTSPPQEHLNHFLTNTSPRKKHFKTLSRPASKDGYMASAGGSRRPSASGKTSNLNNATSETSLTRLVESQKSSTEVNPTNPGLPASVGATLSKEDPQLLEGENEVISLTLKPSNLSEADHDFERGLGDDFVWGSKIGEGGVDVDIDESKLGTERYSPPVIVDGSRRGSATTFALSANPPTRSQSRHHRGSNLQTQSQGAQTQTQRSAITASNQAGTYGTSSYGSDDPHGVESLGSTLNRQASLLMLLYPAAYCLLFSVSIIRIIDDLASRKTSTNHQDDALHSVARWFIFAQGALDAIIFQFIERRE